MGKKQFLIGLILFVSITSNLYAQNYQLSAYNFGSLGKLTPVEQIKLLKKTGYKGLILNSETKSDSANLNFFLKKLRGDRKFRIHAVMVRYNFTDTPAKREGWKKIVDQISNRDIQLWVIFGKRTEGFNADFIEAKLNEMVAYTNGKNVGLVLYPHSNCVIASAEEALPFVQKINNPNLSLAVHLCHEIRAGNGTRLEDVFNAVKGHIGAVTVCGADSVADFSKPLLMDKSTIKPIGRGNFEMQKFIKPLRNSGYQGLIGFINFKIDEEPEMYLKSSITFWNKLTK